MGHDAALEVGAEGGEGAYAHILACGELAQVGGVVLGIILGVGVEHFEHVVGGIVNVLGRIESVDIVKVEVAVQGIEYVEVLGHLKVVVRSGGLCAGGHGHGSKANGDDATYLVHCVMVDVSVGSVWHRAGKVPFYFAPCGAGRE